MCAALPGAEAPCSFPAALCTDAFAAVFGAAGASAGAKSGAAVPPPPAIAEEVAEMAAAWAQLLAAPGSPAAAQFALAGIAACVLVAACPRCGCLFWLRSAAHCVAAKNVLCMSAHRYTSGTGVRPALLRSGGCCPIRRSTCAVSSS